VTSAGAAALRERTPSSRDTVAGPEMNSPHTEGAWVTAADGGTPRSKIVFKSLKFVSRSDDF
jgi:hypothetical protein